MAQPEVVVDVLEELDPITDAPVFLPPEPDRAAPADLQATPADGGRGQTALDVGLPLRANRDFKIVAVGQGLSAIGDGVSLTAMPLLVLALTGSGVQMGIVGILGHLPDLLFGLPAGALADRLDRRRMMLAADLARAILTALIPLSVLVGIPTMGVVLLVAFPISVGRVFFMAAWTAAVPNLVGRPQIARATSILEAFNSASFIVGPALAGILVSQIGAAQTLALDAMSFAISAASLSLVHRSLRSSRPPVTRHLPGEIREGVGYIRHHEVLRLAIALFAVDGICLAPVISAMTFYITLDRGLSPASLGFVIAAYSLGSLAGALAAGRLVRDVVGPLLLLSNLASGVAILGLSFAESLTPLLLLAFALGLAQGIVVVVYLTLRAKLTPDQLLGRVGSTARTLSGGLQPIGFLIGGLLLDLVGGASTLLVIAAGMIASTAAFALSTALRGARLEPPLAAPAA